MSRQPGVDRGRLQPELAAGIAALGLSVPSTAVERLLDYLALLAKWNAVYNLTAVRNPEAMLVQHLLDSLSVVGPLAERGRAVGASGGDAPPFAGVLDVGSGGGLPGIVLAIVWPEVRIDLVEPVGKKAAFLRQCALELALTHVNVHAARVEDLGGAGIPVPGLVICRAFAALPDFVAGIGALVGPTTIVAAMKGVVPHEEIAALADGWAVREILPLSVPQLAAERHLLLLGRSGGATHSPG